MRRRFRKEEKQCVQESEIMRSKKRSNVDDYSGREGKQRTKHKNAATQEYTLGNAHFSCFLNASWPW
jgi:hypothetical protein